MPISGPHPRSQRAHWKQESGQETLELTGLLVLVAAIFTMMFTLGLPGKVAQAVYCAVGTILRIDVCTPGPAYPVSVTTKTVGYDGRVVIVDAGHQYVLTLTKLSDGTAQIALVNTGSVGVSARVGGDVELGPLGGASAEAAAGGGVYVSGSTTWSFPSWSVAEKYWHQVSGGNSAGLALNDATGSVPFFGGAVTGIADAITGAKGAPTSSSISKRYLSATAIGGGAQGDANAGASVDLGPIDAGIKASVTAQGGLERINSGSQKGDWQASVTLTADGDGSLGEALFGSHAGAGGSVNGGVTVIFGPGWTPEQIDVTASGDGVWQAAGPSSDPPDGHWNSGDGDSGSGGDGSGGNGSGGNGGDPASGEGGHPEPAGESGEGGGEGDGGDGGDEPTLALSHESDGGSGYGSSFVGKLDVSNDPQAQAALEGVLTGNLSDIAVIAGDMNARGWESVQSYRLSESNSSWGGQLNLGGGGGAQFNDGTSTACYSPPEVREGGGKWTTASFGGAQGC